VAGERIVNVQSFARSLLRLRLALARVGAGPLLAGALLVAAALLWLGLVPGMSARVADETRSVARLRTMPVPKPVVPAPVLAAARLADFYDRLGDSAHTGEIVMHLFEAAAAAGVTLDKAEYKPGHDTPGRFDTYTMVLPVKGDYTRLRQFSGKVLAAVPYAALDDMRFKRNSANDADVEANLRFTAFLRPVTIGPVSASEGGAAEVASGAAVGASGAMALGASAAAGASGAMVSAAQVVSAASGVAGAAAQGAASARAPAPIPVSVADRAPGAASVTDLALPVTPPPATAVAMVAAEVPQPIISSMPASAPARTRGVAAGMLRAHPKTTATPSAESIHPRSGAAVSAEPARATRPVATTVSAASVHDAASAPAPAPAHETAPVHAMAPMPATAPAHTTAPALVTIATIPAHAAWPALPIIAVPLHGAAAPLALAPRVAQTVAPNSAAAPAAAGIASPVTIAPPPPAAPAKSESNAAAARAALAASSPAPRVPASAPVAPPASAGASAPTAGPNPPAAAVAAEGAAP
jgi:hypothetical protein